MHGKFRLISQGKASSHSMALPNFWGFFLCAVFLCSVIHRTLTWNTGFLTCIRSYVMRAYTQHGGGAHRQRVSATFWLGKTHKFFIALRTGFESLVMESIGSRGRRSTNWAATSPIGAPKLVSQRCPNCPAVKSCFCVQGAGLSNVLRGLWACITWAVFGVWQTQALHVGTKETVSSSESEHCGLLVAIEWVTNNSPSEVQCTAWATSNRCQLASSSE